MNRIRSQLYPLLRRGWASLGRRRLPLLRSREAYALWDYPPHAHNPFMQIEESTLREMLPDLRGRRVLDAACGSGRWGRIAQELGAALVISVDESLPMLRQGSPRGAAQASLLALPLPPASVEVVICGLALGHIADLGRALHELGRVIRPGGSLLLSDVHPFRAWMGAQRHFRARDGRHYAIEHYPHSYADYHEQAQAVGLRITALREVAARVGEPPVLLALRLEKVAHPAG